MNFSNLKSFLSAYYSQGWECLFIRLYKDSSGKKRVDFLGRNWKDTFTKTSVNRYVNDNLLHSKVNSIAVKTGQQSNLFILDLDISDGKNGIENFSKLNVSLPENTVSAKTASGGIHYYFLFPEQLRDHSTGSNLFEQNSGLDLRGSGGLVFAPPSQTKNGGVYKWIVSPFQGELRLPPEKLIKLILDYYREKRVSVNSRSISDATIPQINETLPQDISKSQKNILFTCLNDCAIAKIHTRSEKDYDLIKWSIKIGMPKNELWILCQDVGRFKESGFRYFETTYNNCFSKG